MAKETNLTRKKHPKGGKNHFLYTGKFQYKNTIEDYVSSNGFIRRLLIHEREINKTILKLYIKLPWNLRLDFLGLINVPVDQILSDINDENLAPKEKEKKKKEEIDKYLDNNLGKIISIFNFQILDRKKLIKCIDEDGKIMAEVSLDIDPFEYQLAFRQFQMQWRDHSAFVDIKYDANVGAQIDSIPELKKDLAEFIKIQP